MSRGNVECNYHEIEFIFHRFIPVNDAHLCAKSIYSRIRITFLTDVSVPRDSIAFRVEVVSYPMLALKQVLELPIIFPLRHSNAFLPAAHVFNIQAVFCFSLTGRLQGHLKGSWRRWMRASYNRYSYDSVTAMALRGIPAT